LIDRPAKTEKGCIMIHVIATIEVRPGQREAFLAEFRQVLPAVLAEAGCLAYGPAIDAETGIDRQTRKGQDTVTIIEQWDSVDHLKAHLAAPHMLAYREKIKDIVLGATLHILEPA
jgi:quinol monooxygenase YgiN